MDYKNTLKLIRQLRSNEKILASEEQDLAELARMKIPYNKDGLQTLLANGVFIVEYQNAEGKTDWMLCTSHTAIVHVFQTKREEDRKKIVDFQTRGIACKDLDRVLTWDLSSDSLKTILTKRWDIKFAILAKPEKDNVLAIDRILRALLK